MMQITLVHNSPFLKRVAYNGDIGVGTMVNPTREVTEWFREMSIPLRYEKVWYSPGGDLRRSPVPTLRFMFEDENHALMFKLAWGGQ